MAARQYVGLHLKQRQAVLQLTGAGVGDDGGVIGGE
jgi:hypothetical protein